MYLFFVPFLFVSAVPRRLALLRSLFLLVSTFPNRLGALPFLPSSLSLSPFLVTFVLASIPTLPYYPFAHSYFRLSTLSSLSSLSSVVPVTAPLTFLLSSHSRLRLSPFLFHTAALVVLVYAVSRRLSLLSPPSPLLYRHYSSASLPTLVLASVRTSSAPSPYMSSCLPSSCFLLLLFLDIHFTPSCYPRRYCHPRRDSLAVPSESLIFFFFIIILAFPFSSSNSLRRFSYSNAILQLFLYCFGFVLLFYLGFLAPTHLALAPFPLTSLIHSFL